MTPGPRPAVRGASGGGTRKPKPCIACRDRVVAWTTPRVDYCYRCLPGGPFSAPPCRRCASRDYYSQGLCVRCHQAAPQAPSSCRDCLSWGVIRKHKWLCWRCRSWRRRFTDGTCRSCGRSNLPVNQANHCNLCDRQTVIRLGCDIEQANAHGQQLYLANMPWPATKSAATASTVRRALGPRSDPNRARRQRPAAPEPFSPVQHSQLLLFDMPHDLRAAQRKGPFRDPPDPPMAAFLDAAVSDHGARHGWTRSTIIRVRTAMRVLQSIQDTPGATLLASDALLLHHIDLPANPVIAVATAAGLMLDDRQPAIHAWFASTIAELPTPMRGELTEWFDVMLAGSHTPPRRLPRNQQTIRCQLRWAMPVLTAWSQQGHQSLREISAVDVRAVLPPAGNPRSTTGAGLRSILTLLKARKILFVNPIARIRTGGHERRAPLPAHTDAMRAALTSADPAGAALTALVTFHGLRARELSGLLLTDIVDRRLRLTDRTINLADPVRVRLTAWLEHRSTRWPHSANPHLFIHYRTATTTAPVGGRWFALKTGIPVHVMREDRILNEVQATDGDIRRICDLFGLTVAGAIRYLPATPDLDAADKADASSPTHGFPGRR